MFGCAAVERSSQLAVVFVQGGEMKLGDGVT